jgi:hypothetical protein
VQLADRRAANSSRRSRLHMATPRLSDGNIE